jgi:cobalt transporter subunit CbtB
MQTSVAGNSITQTSVALPITGTRVRTSVRLWPSMAVFFFGLVVTYAVEFSTMPKVHNATHDTRHANGFPCH